MIIRVWYRGVDGYRERVEFRTLGAAREYASRMVGGRPEVGERYAVSSDGVGTIRVYGEELRQLFPLAG